MKENYVLVSYDWLPIYLTSGTDLSVYVRELLAYCYFFRGLVKLLYSSLVQ